MILRDGQSILKDPVNIKLDEKVYSKEMQKVLTSKDFCDFEFIFGEKKIQAHKAILSARSKVFSDMFGNDEEELKDLEVTDVTFEIFEMFIIYLYTEHLPDDCFAQISALLQLAEKYCVADLKEKCGKILEANLNVSTALEIYKLAHRFNLNSILIVNSFKLVQE